MVTALLLALIFRAFAVEPFMIPTGSMADGLLGEHARIVCPRCGFSFSLGLTQGEAAAEETVFCPNCHDYVRSQAPRRAGDRILVNKWIYDLRSPRRWEVLVFRDPLDPEQNFIKRLAALPGEAIEIVDGDVYIRAPDAPGFQIAPKTPQAQSMLWSTVFSQAHVPTSTPDAWQPVAWVEIPADDRGGWSGERTRVLHCAAPPEGAGGEWRTLHFDPRGSRRYFRDVSGYNGATDSAYVADLRIVASVEWISGAGALRFQIVRDDDLFTLELSQNGVRLLARLAKAEEVQWSVCDVGCSAGAWIDVDFGHVDQRVYARLNGSERVASPLGSYGVSIEQRRGQRRVAPPRVSIAATDLEIALHGLRIERDVHYSYDEGRTRRAFAGSQFELGPGEFFVLGDNSLSSFDSRDWSKVGPQLRADLSAGTYKLGTVRESQIVGQAFFVYLPGLQPVDDQGRFRFLDVGRMRFIR